MGQTVCVIVSALDRKRLEAVVSDRNRQRKHTERAEVVLASGTPGRFDGRVEQETRSNSRADADQTTGGSGQSSRKGFAARTSEPQAGIGRGSVVPARGIEPRTY